MKTAPNRHFSSQLTAIFYSFVTQIFRLHSLLSSLFGTKKNYFKTNLIPAAKTKTISLTEKKKLKPHKTTVDAKKEQINTNQLSDLVLKINKCAFKRGLALHVMNETFRSYDHGFTINNDTDTESIIDTIKQSTSRDISEFDDETENANANIWFTLNQMLKTKGGYGHSARKLVTALQKQSNNDTNTSMTETQSDQDNNSNYEQALGSTNDSASYQNISSEGHNDTDKRKDNPFVLIRNKIAHLLTDLINVRYNHSENVDDYVLYPLYTTHNKDLSKKSGVFSMAKDYKDSELQSFSYNKSFEYQCWTKTTDSTTTKRIVTAGDIHDFTFKKPVIFKLTTIRKQQEIIKASNSSNLDYELEEMKIDFSQRLTIVVLNTMLELFGLACVYSKEKEIDQTTLESITKICDEYIYPLPNLLIDTIRSQTAYKNTLTKPGAAQSDIRLTRTNLLSNIDKLSELLTSALTAVDIDYAKDNRNDDYHATSQGAALIGFCSDSINIVNNTSFDTGTPNTSPTKTR